MKINCNFFFNIIKKIINKFPMIGNINGKYIVPPIKFLNDKFGESFFLPTVLKIKIKDKNAMPGNVGKIVKNELFSKDPDFIFNVFFSCGDSGLRRKGSYTNPTSIWFNVFFGYYEIDVQKSKWNRPFGYNNKKNNNLIKIEEIIKIGIADWNYFSNYLYGVPKDKIKKFNSNDLKNVIYSNSIRKKIGNKYWDLTEVDNMEVVTAYTTESGKKKLANPSILSPLWRFCFGLSHPVEGFNENFFNISMKAKFYTYYKLVKDPKSNSIGYKTFIFGGTINNLYKNKKQNQSFLDMQIKAIEKLIESHYCDLGWD